MAEDLVPGLLEEIRKEFRRGYEGSSKARQLLKKVQDGTATYEEAQEYAREVQRITGAAWEKCVSSGTLPEGRMYYNIASRLVPSQLDGNYELVSGYAQQVQQGINDRSGIGLKALRAEPDRDRVDGLVELAANAEDYDSVAGRLMAGMANYLQHTVDETLRANAGFQYDAGLSPKIVRSVNRPCCKWCAALAGTYEYAQVKRQGHDVWRRHENCDCLIEYVAGSGKRETVGNYRRAKDAQGRRDVAATDDREGREERIRLSKAAEGLPNRRKDGKIGEETGLRQMTLERIPITQEAIDSVPLVKPAGWSDQKAERLQTAHKNLLAYVKDQPLGTEAYAIYTPDMAAIQTSMGEAGQDSVLIPYMEQRHYVLHNHPDGQIFSESDIFLLIDTPGMEMISAIGNNGTVYMLTKSVDYDGFKCYEAYLRMQLNHPNMKKRPENYIDAIVSFCKECEQYGLSFNVGGAGNV